MSYVGIPPFGQTIRTVVEQVATAGQTSFTITGGYVPGYIDLELNGSGLLTTDFVATNGSTITLNVAANAGDELKSIAYWPVSLIDTYRKSEVDADFVKKNAGTNVAVDLGNGSLSAELIRLRNSSTPANARWQLDAEGAGTQTLNLYWHDGTNYNGCFQMDTSGNMTLSRGNLVLANGKGIDFSDTANGGGTVGSELLDDYEWGTWTPVVRSSNANATFSSTVINSSWYVKVGGVVAFGAYITVVVTSAGTGSLQIAGLPFNNGGGYTAFTNTHDTLSGSSGGGYIIPNTNVLSFLNANSTGELPINGTGTRYCMVNGTYKAA